MKKKLILFSSLILIIVIGIFVIAQQGEEPEVTENLTHTSYQTNTLNLGNNSFAQISYLGFVNYYNGSEFLPINTSIESKSLTISGRDYSFGVDKGIYEAYFRDISSDVKKRPMAIVKDDYVLTFSPQDKISCNPKKATKSGDIGNRVLSNAITNENTITYPNQYNKIGEAGSFANLTYEYLNTQIKENLVILEQQYIRDRFEVQCEIDENPNLVFKNVIRAYHSEDLDNETMGVTYGLDKVKFKEFGLSANDEITTSERIDFTDSLNNTVYYIPVLYAYDSNGSSIVLNKTLSMTDFGNLRIDILTPFNWLNDSSRVYPVYIDPSVGPQSTGLGENIDNLWGSRDWTNPTNIYTSNNVYSSVGLDGPYEEEEGEASHYLRATHFDFTAIPAGATIDGIVVEFEKKSDEGFIEDDHVYIVKTGTEQGNNKAIGYWSTIESYVSYGGTTDKWGLTWTQAQINSTNFGVSVNVYNSEEDSSDTAYIDHVRITVYYTGVGPQNFYINIGDSWQTATDIYVNVGDVWQDVEAVYVNVGDVWQQIFSI